MVTCACAIIAEEELSGKCRKIEFHAYAYDFAGTYACTGVCMFIDEYVHL
jgi:hypothetical protein